MANAHIQPDTDIKRLKRELKQQGLVLRTYHQPNGEIKYTVRKNTYQDPPIQITIPEIHERLNKLAGRRISSKHLSILLACWKQARHKKNTGRKGWLSVSEADDFIHYAW